MEKTTREDEAWAEGKEILTRTARHTIPRLEFMAVSAAAGVTMLLQRRRRK